MVSVCVHGWGEYRSAGYTEQHFSFSWDFAKCVSVNEGYKHPILLPSGVDSELVLKRFFIFVTLKARVICLRNIHRNSRQPLAGCYGHCV